MAQILCIVIYVIRLVFTIAGFELILRYSIFFVCDSFHTVFVFEWFPFRQLSKLE